MMKNLTMRLVISAVVCCLAISFISARQSTTVYKITISGFPQFQCNTLSVFPLGTTSGLLTFVKTADSKMDQQLTNDMNNNTAISSMDVIFYSQDAAGNLTQTKSYHFTKLSVKSVVANYSNVTSSSISYEGMTTTN